MMTFNTTQLTPVDYVIDARTSNLASFQFFAEKWKSERGAQSTAAAMAILPSYQSIIGMGKEAIPLILAQLELEGDKPDHWFWALAAISHENPVPTESRGNLPEMAKAWIAWGRKEGYVE